MPNGGGVKKKKQNKAVHQPEDPGLAAKLDRLLSRIPKGTFATVGGLLGPKGAAAGHALSTITGYGDYTVTKNSLMNQTVVGEMADQVPVFKNQGADTRVKHCEFVMDLKVPSTGPTYSVTALPIDPTDINTFPWLASVAKKYQKYKVKGMVIGYRSTSTDYNNSGVVAIAVNYDPAERAYASMDTILNTKFAVSTKPSNSMLAPVECDPARSPQDGYYMKHTTSYDVTDATIRQTRMGTINVATQGLSLPAGTTIGQLYVSYDIEMLYPYMSEAAVSTTSGISGVVNFSSQAGLDGSLAQAYGDLVGYGNMSGSQIGMKWLTTPTSSGSPWYQLVFPPGRYRLATLDSNWATSGASVNGGASAGPLSHGSAVTITQVGVESMVGYTASSYGYEFTVADGLETDRVVTPALAANRTQTGSVTYIVVGITIEKIG
jgi:hypothetical protein